MSKSNVEIRELPRQIVHRTRGLRHGAITRLMSPSDVGHILKPFVFLDLFDTEGTKIRRYTGTYGELRADGKPARIIQRRWKLCSTRLENQFGSPAAIALTTWELNSGGHGE